MGAMTKARRVGRERVLLHQFEVRLVSQWNAWDEEPVQTFKAGRFKSSRRCTARGFESFRETMKRNGFLLVHVRISDEGRGAA
jgi:hypothetical protein